MFFLLLTGCDNNSELIIPDLRLTETEFSEAEPDGKIFLPLELVEKADNEVNYQYSLENETAKEGDDYIKNEGMITFPPGVQAAVLEIDLVNDSYIELRESFLINFESGEKSDKTFQFRIFISNDDLDYEISQDSEGFITPDTYPSMQLVWSDEFDGTDLNTNNWTYELGNGCDKGICGWGNSELEKYTDSKENVFIENNRLVIKATEKVPDNYESGRIITDNKQEYKFGRIDIRAKLPEGQGIWPALWMLGNNIDQAGWPACGEIDIMEAKGQSSYFVQGTIHYDANGYRSSTGTSDLGPGEKFGDKFHVFSLLWDHNTLTWFVDYEPFKSVNASSIGSTYPFNQEFFFIFNVAVGGNYVGAPDQTTVFPQQMEIDYIRLFQ